MGADRFDAEVAQLRPAAKRSRAQQRLFGVKQKNQTSPGEQA
jgi:hypothetical protein